MKYIKIIAALSLLLLLGGCCGTEPNDVAYIVAVGFDNAENNDNYKITIQFARPTNISGGSSESGGSGEEIVENVAVEAPDLYSGISLADNILSKQLTLAHANLIVFSEEVAKDGVGDILETLSRSEEIRPDIYLAVALESAQKYLYEVKPVIEINPTRYYQLIYDKHCIMGLPKKDLVNFYFDEESKSCDSVLPLAGVISTEDSGGGKSGGEKSGGETKEGGMESGSSGGGGSGNSDEGTDPEKTANTQQTEAPRNPGSFEFKLRDYIAGQVAVNQKNKSEATGMVIFKDKKEVMHAGSTETELYKMLTGSMKTTYIALENENKEPVTIDIEQNKKPEYRIDKKNKKVKIKMLFDSDIYSLPADYIIEENIQTFENLAKKEIEEAANKFIKDIIKANNVDLLGLRGRFRKYFLTNAQYEKAKDEIMDYDIDVEVVFKIRRTGLTIKE